MGDLLKPELKGRIASPTLSTSSSAYEHLINMLYAMGDGEPGGLGLCGTVL